MTPQSSCPPPLKEPLLNPTSNGDCSLTLLSSPSDDESTTTTTRTTIFSIIVGYIYAWVGKILTRILHVLCVRCQTKDNHARAKASNPVQVYILLGEHSSES